MKQVYRLLCGLLLLTIYPAQAQTTDSLRTAIDHIFAPLDKVQVPVPYLAEYGNRFTSLTPYNGTLTDSSVTTLTAWRLLYASVLSGNVGRPSPLPPLPDLNAALAAQVAATPAAIPLVVQCLPYAALRPDALTAGLLTAQNGQLYDVPNRAASPYLARTVFAAAPATPVAPTGAVSFVFAPGLHVHGGGTGTGSVSTLSLDFGDGRGYQAASWNVPLSAQYCTAGSQRVKVRLTYVIDGRVSSANAGAHTLAALPPRNQTVSYESWFDFYVQEASCAANRYDQSDVPQLVHTFDPLPGVHSGGKAYVRFGGSRSPGDQTIRRPLIVAEGYDGFSVAPAVYKQGNYGVQDFINDTRRTGFYSNLENAAGSVTGYDIIFLDYANGTDDIRRNAALFEEVVRWVNGQKAGGIVTGEQNVVLGISMGGLVARYGLADMIKHPTIANNDPHTRLLITHDSPHQGANTPLGIQMLTRQAAGTLAGQGIRFFNNAVTSPPLASYFSALAVFPELQQADDLLNAPATQQLSIVRASRVGIGRFASFGAEYNSFLANDYRSMITPAAGQAFPYHFIATSLGSQCGREVLAPHAELIRVERSGYLGLVGLTTGYRTEVIVNAMPLGGQTERISSLRVWNETHVLGISTGRIYLSNFVFHSPGSNPIAWDGLPGGTQPIRANYSTLKLGSSYFDRLELVVVWGSSSTNYLADNFSFVPRFSALDVQTPDPASLTGIYINGITNGSASRAEKVIAQAQGFLLLGGQGFNETHPYFPARQARWIFNEMQQPFTNTPNTAGCDTECAITDTRPITGPVTICGTSTFTSPLQGPNYTYTWTAIPANLFTVSSGTGPTFQTSNVTNGGGVIQLAISSGGCTPTNLFKDVAVGAPGSPATRGPDWGNDCGRINRVCTIDNFDPQASYAISVTGALSLVGTGVSSTGTYTVRSGPNGGQLGHIEITATNANCGTSSVSALDVYTPCGDPGRRAASTATLYPNPARETVEVYVENADAAHPVTVRLFDGYGRARAEQTSTGATSVRLATDKLPAGLYFVHILRGQQVLSRQQLRIEK